MFRDKAALDDSQQGGFGNQKVVCSKVREARLQLFEHVQSVGILDKGCSLCWCHTGGKEKDQREFTAETRFKYCSCLKPAQY